MSGNSSEREFMENEPNSPSIKPQISRQELLDTSPMTPDLDHENGGEADWRYTFGSGIPRQNIYDEGWASFPELSQGFNQNNNLPYAPLPPWTGQGGYPSGVHRAQPPSAIHEQQYAPTGVHGNVLALGVKLYGLNIDRDMGVNTFGSWTWPEQTGASTSHAQNRHLYNITSARTWFDAERQHLLDLTCTTSTDIKQDSSPHLLRWLHVEQKAANFDEFSAIALNTPRLSKSWKIVILGLLERVRKWKRFEKDQYPGAWLLRADSQDLGITRKEDVTLTATSIGFPSFALGPSRGHKSENDPQQDLIMSLFQLQNQSESAKDWDFDQMYSRLAGSHTQNEIVYIPHVWSLLFDNVIITYGPLSVEDMVGKSIRILETNLLRKERPSSVRATGLYGCDQTFDIRQCPTYFELRHLIELHCLSPLQTSYDDVDIMLPNRDKLTGSTWLKALESEETDVLNLIIRRKNQDLPHVRFQTTLSPRPRQAPFGNNLLPISARRSKPSDQGNAREGNDSSENEDVENDSSDSKEESDSASSTSKDSSPASGSISSADTIGPLNLSAAIVTYDGKAAQKPSRFAPPTEPHPENWGQAMALSVTRASSAPLANHYLRHAWHDGSRRTRIKKFREHGVLVFGNLENDLNGSPSIFVPPTKIRKKDSLEETSNDTLRSKNQLKSPHTSSTGRRRHTASREGSNSEIQSRPELSRNDAAIKVSISPFLSWAANARAELDWDDDVSERPVEYIQRILEAVHERLKSQWPGQRAKMYKRAFELSKEQLERTHPSPKSKPKKKDDTLDPHTQRHGTSLYNEESDQNPKSDVEPEAIWDSVHEVLFKKLKFAGHNLHEKLEELLSFYLPLSSNHALVHKCWGALDKVLSIDKIALHKAFESSRRKQALFWTVRDVSNDERTASHTPANRSWADCPTCKSKYVYMSSEAAFQHVRDLHFGASSHGYGKNPVVTDETLHSWVRSNRQHHMDRLLEMYTRPLDLASGYMRRVFAKAQSIRAGVANDRDSKSPQYMLPSSLVKSLESIVTLLVYTAHSFAVISKYRRDFDQFTAPKAKLADGLGQLVNINDEIDDIGRTAVLFMEKAEQDIMLMAHTDVDTGTISYDAVGPEYILATIMSNLSCRPLDGAEQIDQVYDTMYWNLHRDAMKHPRTRVLPDIWRMREELYLVKVVTSMQWRLLLDFRETLRPCTIRVTTVRRTTRFPTESRFLATEADKRKETQLKLEGLQARLEDISKHVSRMLEIQQENNGNAIIVFTLVTIIFLPLSWATSYLGMNTADVRNLQQGQWLFWTVALPLTATIMGLALVIVFKGETIREHILRRHTRRSRKQDVETRTVRRQSTLMSVATTDSTRGEIWSRFRRRKTKAVSHGEV